VVGGLKTEIVTGRGWSRTACVLVKKTNSLGKGIKRTLVVENEGESRSGCGTPRRTPLTPKGTKAPLRGGERACEGIQVTKQRDSVEQRRGPGK